MGTSYHAFTTPPPSCDVSPGVDDHSGDHNFGDLYPFEFPTTSTFNGTEPCPDGGGDMCEVWKTPEAANNDPSTRLPHHILWYVRPQGAVAVPVRAILVLQYDGPIPVCLEFSHFDSAAPPMSAFT